MDPETISFDEDEINYNCAECPSLIEIKAISEKDNTIKFICINKNEEKTFNIKEYLEKMQNFKNDNNIKDECDEHNMKFLCYCTDCKCNLCKSCLEERIHKNHHKEITHELKPKNEELKIIEDKKEEYDKNIKILEEEKKKQ